MKLALPPIVVAALLAFLFTSCETTSDYGYYVGGLDEQTIETLFAISDEAANNQDFTTYSDLYAPGFYTTDRTNGSRVTLYRTDYLEMVDNIFKNAKYIQVTTMIMDIEYIEPGRKALVKIQEEQKHELFGDVTHLTSHIDIEVGHEDGWLFFQKATRTASQTIKD